MVHTVADSFSKLRNDGALNEKDFLGQFQAFFNVLNQLAVEADSVTGGF